VSGPIGLDGFNSWYEGQEEIFSKLIEWYYGPKRFCGASIPTGSGKSVLAMALAKSLGGRSVILTATKGLQEQMMSDFSMSGLVNIKGMANYECMVEEVMVDKGPCHDLSTIERYVCDHRNAGLNQCHYYKAKDTAMKSNLVTTNYAYYMAMANLADGFGKSDLLIMDEGHQVFQTFESYLTTNIPVSELPKPLPINKPWSYVRDWAVEARHMVGGRVDNLVFQINSSRPGVQKRILNAGLERLRRYYADLGYMEESKWAWSVEVADSRLRATPLWPQEHAYRLVYKDTPKVMIMSAVLTKKTMNLLGVEDDQMEFIEAGSTYDPLNTRIRHIYTTRLTHKTPPEETLKIARRVDEIVAAHPNQKGIVFTVSYKRRDFLLRHCDTSRFMTHESDTVTSQVEKFRDTADGVLLSPVITTGWDFPGSDCEFIVIVKIPFIDTRSAVVRERGKDDNEWMPFQAMQTLIQSAGRGTRSKGDTCDVYVLDDNWGWFWKRYKKFAPDWFAERVRGSFAKLPA